MTWVYLSVIHNQYLIKQLISQDFLVKISPSIDILKDYNFRQKSINFSDYRMTDMS